MELMNGFLVCFMLVGAIRSLEATDPCTTSLGNYETFIQGVREDTPVGSVIGALDIQGSDSEVALQQKTNQYLQLELPSRNITLQSKLDTDKGLSTLRFYTLCSPTSQPSMTVTVTLRVILVDVNDHPPIFPQDQYTVNISEDTAKDTIVFRKAKAQDEDLYGAGNDIISYSIVPGPFSDYFEYEYPLYPDLALKKILDFETTKTMEIEIIAEDNPVRLEDRLNSTVILKINVQDADDLNPIFHHDQYYGTVSANSLPGTIVQIFPEQILAYDQDTLNAAVTYELKDPKGMFKINDKTGEVTVNGNLGSDAKTSVVLTAIQEDNQFRWCIAMLHINITGVAPPGEKNETIHFQFQHYDVYLSESTPTGTTVKSLHPLGVSQTKTLTYTILESQSEFNIKPSGHIILQNLLDYEQKQYHTITVSVSDGTNSATTVLNFTVIDVNDNNPKIETKIITLSAERVKGTELTVIRVSDQDGNSQISFQLLTHQSLFAVSPNGKISIIGSKEDLTDDRYVLTISVKDNAVPIRESVAVVIVNFPKSSAPPVSSRIMTENNDILAIGLGVAAAFLFIVVILLVIYIIRRRLYRDEQLDRVKRQRGMDPRGLTYRPGDPSPVPSNFDLKFNGDLEETSEIDGSTSIQDNPLSDNRYRYGYPNLNGDVDILAGDEEIHIDTAVVPFERDEYFRNSGRMKTFGHDECNSSDNSYASDSTGDSNKGLMRNLKKQALSNGSMKTGNTNRLPTYMSDSVLESRLDQKPNKEKPEITVYF